MQSPFRERMRAVRRLAFKLDEAEIYRWLSDCGYFPESYALPPCFRVLTRPSTPKLIHPKGKIPWSELEHVSIPKSALTGRGFGLMEPSIHNDIVVLIAKSWQLLVDRLVPLSSRVASYSFPLPLDAKLPGRIGETRSGQRIYEFTSNFEGDVATMAHEFDVLARTDIKGFYRALYTHAIAWACHGKAAARKDRWSKKLVGSRLDGLFQACNDGCTNGVPVGPVVSDVVAEIVAAAVDVEFSKLLRAKGVTCEVARFRDDYAILARNDRDAWTAVQLLQQALGEFKLELSDEKTRITRLPSGLFRPWTEAYRAVFPRKPKAIEWRRFQTLYQSVVRIDSEQSGTGVVDRFLADLAGKSQSVRVRVPRRRRRQFASMLFMLARRRPKALPMVLALLEQVVFRAGDAVTRDWLRDFLVDEVKRLRKNESERVFELCWLLYVLRANRCATAAVAGYKPRHVLCKSLVGNRSRMFPSSKGFMLFEKCSLTAKRASLLRVLDPFAPPV